MVPKVHLWECKIVHKKIIVPGPLKQSKKKTTCCSFQTLQGTSVCKSSGTNGPSVLNPPPKAHDPLKKRGQEDWKSHRLGKVGTLSFRYGRTTALTNSQQLWMPVQTCFLFYCEVYLILLPFLSLPFPLPKTSQILLVPFQIHDIFC